MARDRFTRQSLGVLSQRIEEACVLLVGAGGIGCELLKNLVLTGYGEIHIVDLDTIDLSNLNRQFLFRQEHIKKSKAIVAKEVAQNFNPKVKLTAYHANIKDAQFNIKWFANFSMVFNALDNLEARRHVNRMCLATDIPLIESGTTGFNGQVQVIKRGQTACYDCSPKETPKTYPVCTIRSTPSQPIHSIVWAKSYLLPELFGMSENEASEFDNTANADNADEIAKLKEEADALKQIRESMNTDAFASLVFNKVFKEDIERLAKMEDMWKSRPAPKPISYEDLAKGAATANETAVASVDQRTWTLPETFEVFKDSVSRLSTRLEEQMSAIQPDQPRPIIIFDKDDEDTLDFVVAASNLRSHVFGIEPKSKFDVKQMAGNIIPAIATTNAMVAGLCVMQSFKVLKGDYDRTKMIFLDRGKIAAGANDKPNPECAVCGVVTTNLRVDLENATLNELVNGVLKEQLGYKSEISIVNEAGGIIFDPDAEDNLAKKLSELDVKDNSFIIVKDDEDEDARIDLHLIVENTKTEDNNGKSISLVQNENEKLEIKSKPKPKPEADSGTTENLEQANTNGTKAVGTITKRKRELEDDNETAMPSKKFHHTAANKDEPIVLEEGEGEEGIISID